MNKLPEGMGAVAWASGTLVVSAVIVSAILFGVPVALTAALCVLVGSLLIAGLS